MTRIFIDMDDVLCDFKTAFETRKAQFPDVQYPQSEKGFFKGLTPIDGAVSACLLYTSPTPRDRG